MDTDLSREFIFEISSSVGIELCEDAAAASYSSLAQLVHKLLTVSELIAQHCSRTIICSKDIQYASRVVAEADRSSLGLCYIADSHTSTTSPIAYDESISSNIPASEGNDSEYADSAESNDSSGYSTSSSESDLCEEIYDEEEEGSKLLEGCITVLEFGDDLEKDLATPSVRSSKKIATLKTHLQWLSQMVDAFCVTQQTRVAMDDVAFVTLCDVLRQQLELSFTGKQRYVVS